MNQVTLMGRLTRDVELRQTQSQKSVAQFTIAVQRKAKDEADFINCVAWDKQAEFIQKYFKKGNKMAINGRLQTRQYEDKDGKRVYVTEVVVEEIEFCGSRTQETEQVTDEDLPF